MLSNDDLEVKRNLKELSNLKKVLAIILSSFLLLALVGCSSTKTNEKQMQSKQSMDQQMKDPQMKDQPSMDEQMKDH